MEIRIKLFLIALVGFGCALPALASNELRNGADLNNNVAWVSNRVRAGFTYCYERSDSFPMNDEEIKEYLDAAFVVWDRYVKEKRVNERRLAHAGILTKASLVPVCTEAEIVKFIFGKVTPEIEAFKRFYRNPVAFAQPTKERTVLGTRERTGFIWVTESIADVDWRVKNRQGLLAILVHEIGHVFGCDHIEGTIMTPNASLLVRLTGPMRIDMEKELILDPEMPFRYVGTFAPGLSQDAVGALFKKIFGRDMVGQTTVADVKFSPPSRFEFAVEDRLNVERLFFMARGIPRKSGIVLGVFAVDFQGLTILGDPGVLVATGIATQISGNSTISVERNVGDRKLVLSLVGEDNSRQIIFKSNGRDVFFN